MGLTLLEQETVITFNREEDEMEIYTFDPKLIRIFTKFVQEHPDLCRHDFGGTEFHPHIFTLDKHLVRIHPKRMMSDEEKARSAKNFRKTPQTVGSFSANTSNEED